MLTENQIRPSEFQVNKKIAVDADRKFLLNHKAEFINCDCPACESKSHIFFFHKLGIDYHHCQECKTVFVNPRPSEDLLHKFYEQSKTYDFWNKSIFPASDKVRKENIFIPRADKVIEFCKKYNINSGTMLESGAGFGTFCESISELNYFNRVIAVEPTPGLAKTCREKGIEVIELPIEKVEIPDGGVDVIASFEVIEHLFSPKAFLHKCYTLLSENGLLVVSCPNFYGFDIFTLKNASNSIDHEHLNYFNPTSLSHLMNSIGFEVLESITPGKLDLDIVRNKVLAKEFDISDNLFLQTILFDRWDELGSKFQKFIADNNLSSHLWLIAKKI